MSNYGTTQTHSHRDEESQALLNGVPVSQSHNGTFYGRTVHHVHHHRKRYFALWLLAAVAAVSTVIGLHYYEHSQKGSTPAPAPPGEEGALISGLLESMGGKKHPEGGDVCQSDRSYPVAILLSIFFGYVGIDRFYLGYILTAILKLVTAGGLGIWYIVDIVLIVANYLPDTHGCVLA